MHREEVTEIDVCVIEGPVHKEIYGTFIINELNGKYNVDKVFFK